MSDKCPKNVDLSKPWQRSDTVLFVEDETFHVHRKILILCSPTFEEILSSDSEVNNNEGFTLEGKNANEIHELLQHIYSSDSPRELTERSCYFLLDLAQEYRIQKILRKCECYLLESLSTMPVGSIGAEAIDLLVLAQKFDLKELRKRCIEKAIEDVEWKVIQDHELYSKIELSNYREITEGKIALLKWELEDVESKLTKVENAKAVASLCASCSSMASVSDEPCMLSVGCVWASQGMVRVRWDCSSPKQPP